MDVRAAITAVRQGDPGFPNPFDRPLEATYIFPLPDRAGVTAFAADLAAGRVEGELRERGEARREYDEAIPPGTARRSPRKNAPACSPRGSATCSPARTR